MPEKVAKWYEAVILLALDCLGIYGLDLLFRLLYGSAYEILCYPVFVLYAIFVAGLLVLIPATTVSVSVALGREQFNDDGINTVLVFTIIIMFIVFAFGCFIAPRLS